ncbi:winged helix-turn-helix domain-containing protein [Natrinema sp. 1APR25-10V2]|uniref:helix-turn-helix transcriptional regulator n=1 Tax=Natrinema sp. 1APR25-10V2 TaxID=2951081 RepID=UPI002876D91D|nr:winged helix-turn-helix domain-containing protein [Natrinema sp. 1APR25-10V2]MDS0474153.1 winged helix-turn-helix domain-containing protein [Natrinema sp. 1APR25-10V2]
MNEPDPVLGDALEDIAYLSRSENRVRILEALTSEAYPRRELEEVTGTSRTTLGRILSELEERGWAERATDGAYVATPAGKLIANEFRPLVEAMRTVRSLGEAVALLPTDELSIELRHFSDATVRRPKPNEPIEIDRYLADLIRDATVFYALTFLAPPLAVGNAMRDGVLTGRLTAEHVLAGGLVGYLHDHPDGPPPWQDYIEAGAKVYRYDGHIPCNLFIMDETVLLENSQAEKEVVDTVIESQNENVRTWALELLEAYREKSERVDAEMFA